MSQTVFPNSFCIPMVPQNIEEQYRRVILRRQTRHTDYLTARARYARMIDKPLSSTPKDKTMISNFKNFVNKHSDLLFTVGFLILLDHLIFDGAMREKIKSILEKLIVKTEKSLEHKE